MGCFLVGGDGDCGCLRGLVCVGDVDCYGVGGYVVYGVFVKLICECFDVCVFDCDVGVFEVYVVGGI